MSEKFKKYNLKINKVLCKIFGHSITDREITCVSCQKDLTIEKTKHKKKSETMLEFNKMLCRVFGHSIYDRETYCGSCETDLSVKN